MASKLSIKASLFPLASNELLGCAQPEYNAFINLRRRNNHSANHENAALECVPSLKQCQISFQNDREDSATYHNQRLSVYESARPETRRCNPQGQSAIYATHEDVADESFWCAPTPDDTSSQHTSFLEHRRAPLIVKRFIR
jgi:hypothetical protein